MPVHETPTWTIAPPAMDVTIGEALGNYQGDVTRGVSEDQHVVIQAIKELHPGLYRKLDSSVQLAHEIWLLYGGVERAGSLFDENAPRQASRRVRPEAVALLEDVIRAMEDASGVQNRRP